MRIRRSINDRMACNVDCWAHLLWEAGVIHLCSNRLTIGRTKSNDLVIEDECDDRMVSSQHAVILRIGATAMLIDTSLNGTYVNSRRVVKAVLKPNDSIRLGKRRTVNGQPNRYQFVFITKQQSFPRSGPILNIPQVEDLQSALKCTLCQDYLVFPTEITPCTHLLCSACVESFILNNSSSECPECKGSITSFKARTKFNFSGMIEKALKVILSEREFHIYAERVTHRKNDLLQRQRSLGVLREKQESVQYSAKSGDPFLLICQMWSAYERDKFFRGIKRYPYGEAREYYCWMVRLTEEWVLRDANKTDLSVAVSNLNLLKSVNEYSMEEAQDALLRFIYGKQQAVE
jgi:hypothetical protein